MRVLVFLATPHHVHFLKNAIYQLEKKGHTIKIIGRGKDCELELLKAYFRDYELVKFDRGMSGKFFGMFKTDYEVYKIAKDFEPDIMMGSLSVSLAHTGKFLGVPSVIFNDTEHAFINIMITIPFCDFVVTSNSYTNDHGSKHHRYDGYHEIAYLHPNYFKPDSSVLDFLRLAKNEKYVIMRFVSWEASHDLGHSGLSMETKRKIVTEFSKYGKVFITSESPLPKDLSEHEINIHPSKLHDALYFASLYVGEGATTAAESAVLGTPSIYTNPLRLGYTDELEDRYNLLYNLYDQEQIIDKGIQILKSDEAVMEWQDRRKKMLSDKIDVTEYIVDYVENIATKIK